MKAQTFWLGPNGVILDENEYEDQKHNRVHQVGVKVIEKEPVMAALKHVKCFLDAIHNCKHDQDDEHRMRNMAELALNKLRAKFPDLFADKGEE